MRKIAATAIPTKLVKMVLRRALKTYIWRQVPGNKGFTSLDMVIVRLGRMSRFEDREFLMRLLAGKTGRFSFKSPLKNLFFSFFSCAFSCIFVCFSGYLLFLNHEMTRNDTNQIKYKICAGEKLGFSKRTLQRKITSLNTYQLIEFAESRLRKNAKFISYHHR